MTARGACQRNLPTMAAQAVDGPRHLLGPGVDRAGSPASSLDGYTRRAFARDRGYTLGKSPGTHPFLLAPVAELVRSRKGKTEGSDRSGVRARATPRKRPVGLRAGSSPARGSILFLPTSKEA